MRKLVGGILVGMSTVCYGVAALVLLANLARAFHAASVEGFFFALGTLVGGAVVAAPFALLGGKALQAGRARFASCAQAA